MTSLPTFRQYGELLIGSCVGERNNGLNGRRWPATTNFAAVPALTANHLRGGASSGSQITSPVLSALGLRASVSVC